MKIDISELNYQDLLNLEKEIAKAKVKQKAAYKSTLTCYGRFFLLFNDYFAQQGFYKEEARKVASAIESSVSTICDYTLDVYKVNVDKDGNKVTRRSGFFILDDKVDIYRSMCKDLADLIEKYAKEVRK